MTEPGLDPVPAGHIATVVTYLEMTERPAPRRAPPPEGAEVALWAEPGLEDYRDLIRRIGTDWLWSSRLRLTDAALEEVIRHSDVEVWRLMRGEVPLGIAELDFRKAPDCELAFFGVAPEAVGTTAARHLMTAAIGRAWERPIARLFLHTCTLDSPRALGFYRRSGFRDYARAVEVGPDPRLDGTLPRDAAPQVALIE